MVVVKVGMWGVELVAELVFEKEVLTAASTDTASVDMMVAAMAVLLVVKMEISWVYSKAVM